MLALISITNPTLAQSTNLDEENAERLIRGLASGEGAIRVQTPEPYTDIYINGELSGTTDATKSTTVYAPKGKTTIEARRINDEETEISSAERQIFVQDRNVFEIEFSPSLFSSNLTKKGEIEEKVQSAESLNIETFNNAVNLYKLMGDVIELHYLRARIRNNGYKIEKACYMLSHEPLKDKYSAFFEFLSINGRRATWLVETDWLESWRSFLTTRVKEINEAPFAFHEKLTRDERETVGPILAFSNDRVRSDDARWPEYLRDGFLSTSDFEFTTKLQTDIFEKARIFQEKPYHFSGEEDCIYLGDMYLRLEKRGFAKSSWK